MNANHDQGMPQTSSTRLHQLHDGGHRGCWRSVAALTAILLATVAIFATVNHLGIRVAGDVIAWRQWIHDHAMHFFLWRLFLYAATACGWVWMRRRKLQRLPSPEIKRQIQRTEFCIVAFLVVFEVQKWLLRA